MKRFSPLLILSFILLASGCGSGGQSKSQSTSTPGSSLAASSSSLSASNSSASSVMSSSSSSSLAALYPSYNTSPQAPDSEGMASTAAELAARVKLGWNIGNTMEASGGETAWGNPAVNSGLIQLVKSSGFDAVRIPLAWDQYANQSTAQINQEWLDRVEQVVSDCLDNDLMVIINIHWDGGWLENNVTPAMQEANNAKQKAFWEQIATRLRHFDERLLFASANEPEVETAEQLAVLLTYHQTFVDAVRATGGKNAYRVLLVQGPLTDIETTAELWTQMPRDSVADRLMMEVHFYTPYSFTLMQDDQDWGNQFYYWGAANHSATDTAHNPTWGEEDTVDTLFGLMKTQFVDQGIPVVLGEFAAMRRDNLTGDALALHQASRAYYLKYVTERALADGLIPFYWDNGGLDNFSSGIFDRQQNTVFDSRALDALLEGAGKN